MKLGFLTVMSLIVEMAMSYSASADCAWVLWRRYEMYPPHAAGPHWTTDDAFETERQCRAVLEAIWKVEAKNHNAQDAIEKNAVGYVPIRGGDRFGELRLVCFPDTVKPK